MLTTGTTVTADVRSVREPARRPPMTVEQDRDIDISFVAGRSPRREQLIASASGMLWEWRTDLRFVTSDDAGRSSLADSRIVLLVHAGDGLDFDWARAAEAIANGCVVVSETSKGFAPLVPGVHFVMAPYENVVEQAVALAFDEPRRAAMADAARTLTLPTREAAPTAHGDAAPEKRGMFGRRKSTSQRPTNNTLQQMVTEMKVAILAQRELSRSIEATISVVEHGDADHADIVSTSAWQSFEAEVSVVVPLRNEGHRLARHGRFRDRRQR